MWRMIRVIVAQHWQAFWQYGHMPLRARGALLACLVLSWAGGRTYRLMIRMPTRWLNRRFFHLTAWFCVRSNRLWGWAIPQTAWGKKRLSEPRYWFFVG